MRGNPHHEVAFSAPNTAPHLLLKFWLLCDPSLSLFSFLRYCKGLALQPGEPKGRGLSELDLDSRGRKGNPLPDMQPRTCLSAFPPTPSHTHLLLCHIQPSLGEAQTLTQCMCAGGVGFPGPWQWVAAQKGPGGLSWQEWRVPSVPGGGQREEESRVFSFSLFFSLRSGIV